MASLFGHAAVALAAGQVVTGGKAAADGRAPRRGPLFWLLLVACATVADLDVIGFFFGVPYQSPWGHRGFTHSFVFAFVLALAAQTLLSRRLSARWVGGLLLFFTVAASHPLLDSLTNGGLGVAFFWPFDLGRFFLPYRPIEVSPIGVSGFLSERGLEVLWSETFFIFIPCLLAVGARWAADVARRRSRS